MNKYLTKKILLPILTTMLIVFATNSLARAAYTPPVQTEEDFQRWLKDFKKVAIKKGITPSTVETAFKDVHLNHKILKSDRKQPESFSTFWQYFKRATSEFRIKKGQEMYQKHLPQLREITKKYGVPERIIVAFWGLETNYGSYTGYHPIIESLATLSYDPRRSKFFSSELLSALKIIDKNHIQASQMKGSWAGAMGQCQFMPSNYLRYAIDGDNDGKKDLWNSLPDVFNSMGNFLKKIGWQRGEHWGREVSLPKGFDLSLADSSTKRSLQAWQDLGIKLADGRKFPSLHETMYAKLVLPYDYSGPAFLVYKNFIVIKRWNNSDKYALAVGHLADRIVGLGPLSKSQPKNDRSMTRKQVIELQQLLLKQGYKIGNADGIAGSKTRKALRDFQSKHNLPSDGYPSYRMLKILRES